MSKSFEIGEFLQAFFVNETEAKQAKTGEAMLVGRSLRLTEIAV